MDDDHADPTQLESREPSVEDLVDLCRHLNAAGARFLIIGGFAIRAAGYDRRTMDIDVLIAPDRANEEKVLAALDYLPDKAVRELTAGEVSQYEVVRIADEIVIDLMTTASGIGFEEAAKETVVHEIDGVAIPFASPQLLWRMKSASARDKDAADIHFLRLLLERNGEGTSS